MRRWSSIRYLFGMVRGSFRVIEIRLLQCRPGKRTAEEEYLLLSKITIRATRDGDVKYIIYDTQ